MAEEINAPAEQNEPGTTPAEGQGETPQVQEVPTDTNKPESSGEIRDPGAYYKAQAEKLERLLSKEAEQREQLEKRLETVGKSTEDDVKAEFEKLKAELEAERNAAQTARLEAQRAKAIAEAGLPVGAAKFLTGDTDEDITAQVAELRELMPRSGVRGSASAGNPDSSGSTLTMDAIKKMTPQEYVKRAEEVRKFLASQKK